jgi:Holliday junction DNA helicase RuvA
VAELKDKASGLGAGGLSLPAAGKAGAVSAPPLGDAAAEAISALTNLGYQPGQASQAVAAAIAELGKDADTRTLIRRGLKELGR